MHYNIGSAFFIMKLPNIRQANLHKIVILSIAVSLLFMIFFGLNPDTVSIAVLLVPFLLIGVATYIVCQMFGDYVSRFRSGNQRLRSIVSLSIAIFVVSLLVLASIGQLTVKDGVLVAVFMGLFLWYVSRADFLK